MPLIPNYIARFRTHSQSTAASSSTHSASRSNSTAGPSTPGSELVRLAADQPEGQQVESQEGQKLRSQLARKIHPNLSALLDEDAPAEDAAVDLGPRPPRGRSWSAEQLDKISLDAAPQPAAGTQAGQESGPSAAPSPPPAGSPLFSRIFSVPLLSGIMSTPPPNPGTEAESRGPGHWSTFGRRRPLASPAGELGSRRSSGSKGSKSSRRKAQPGSGTVTPSTTRPPSSAARASGPSRSQTVETVPSQQDSPTGTLSSSSRSQSQSTHSHSLRSRRPPLARPETIPDAEPDPRVDIQTPARPPFHASTFTPSPEIVSPSTSKPMLDNTPRTFGRSTPKAADSKPQENLGDAFSSPSALPSSQRKTSSDRDPAATFPRRIRKLTSEGLIKFPSLPSLPRKISAGRLRAEEMFKVDEPRRFSASWSAAEAVRHFAEAELETWPASVSREMVRLSLTGGRNGEEENAPVGDMGTLTDRLKNVTRFGSTGEDRRRFMMANRGRTAAASASRSDSSPSIQHSTSQPVLTVTEISGTDPISTSTGEGAHNGFVAPPRLAVTAPTPTPSPSGSRFGTVTPGSSSPVKRKITEAEEDESVRLPKKSILSNRASSKGASETSQAPSSYRQPKRIRLSTPSEHVIRSASRASGISPPPSPHSRPPSSIRTLPINSRTISQTSIPLSAIVSPRPPSVERRSIYYMRDPALPPSLHQSTQWTGGARKSGEEGRPTFPLQGWAFVLGFVLFPLWWAAAVAPVGWGWRWRTRPPQDGKGKWIEDEDLEAREVWENDVAITWRRRCRFMSVLGLLVYVPIIVLLAVLVAPQT